MIWRKVESHYSVREVQRHESAIAMESGRRFPAFDSGLRWQVAVAERADMCWPEAGTQNTAWIPKKVQAEILRVNSEQETWAMFGKFLSLPSKISAVLPFPRESQPVHLNR